jgi:hypothetical protein
MSEQTFRSPGFFEQEIDLSAKEISPFGVPAGVIGTANKGPAFVPVTIGTFGDFATRFGSLNYERFGPYAVREYLKHKTALTYVRVLGAGANDNESDISNTLTKGIVKNAGFVITGSNTIDGAGCVKLIVASHQRSSNEMVGFPVFTDNKSFSDASGASLGDAEQEEIVRGMIFLANDCDMHIMEIGGTLAEKDENSTVSTDKKFKVVFYSESDPDWSSYENTPGTKVITVSLDPNSSHYISKVLNTDPLRFVEFKHLLYADFPVENELASVVGKVTLLSGSMNTSPNSGDTNLSFRDMFGRFDTRYTTPKTTSFISQPFGSKEYDLFHFETISDGENSTHDFKISIANLRASTDKSNPYGIFEVQVRNYDDSDTSPQILETYPNCTLDPRSDRYVAKVIGDKKVYFDFDQENPNERRLVIQGKYPNKSQRIRVIMNPAVEEGDVPKTCLPFGFRGLPTLKTSDVLTVANNHPLVSQDGRILGAETNTRLFTNKQILEPADTVVQYASGTITFTNNLLEPINVLHSTVAEWHEPLTVVATEEPYATPIWVVGAGKTFETIEDALTDPQVENGHTINVLEGEYEISTAITVSKSVRIVGEGTDKTVIKTEGTGTDPTRVFIIDADNVTLENMKIEHLKTTSTSIEAAIVSQGVGNSFINDLTIRNCEIHGIEFVLALSCNNLVVENCDLIYSGNANNNNRIIMLNGVGGTSKIVGNKFHCSPDINRTRFIYANGGFGNLTFTGELIVSENTQQSGQLQQFLLWDTFNGTPDGIKLSVHKNKFTDTNGAVILVSSTEEFADIFEHISLHENIIAQAGKGILGFDGAANKVRSTSNPLRVSVLNNTVSTTNLRIDYVDLYPDDAATVAAKDTLDVSANDFVFDQNIIVFETVEKDKYVMIIVDGDSPVTIDDVVQALNSLNNGWLLATSSDGSESIHDEDKFNNVVEILNSAQMTYKNFSAIVPPLPFRFKVTRGIMEASPNYLGQSGINERSDTRLYWGISTKRLPTQKASNNPLLEPNSGNLDNGLVRSLTKFLGIQKLDAMVEGTAADEFNNNKFTLARVAFVENTLNNSLEELKTKFNKSASEHMLEAAYVRNGVPKTGTYTVSDRMIENRATLASLIHSDPVLFNRFTTFAKFTNVFHGGFDGVNILDRDMFYFKDKAMSTDFGGKGSQDQPANGLNAVNGENQSGWGRKNNAVASINRAVDILTDSMASNINILVIPGVREQSVTDHALEKVKQFSMAFYVMDTLKYDEDSRRIYDNEKVRPDVRKTSELFEARAVDNNYAATYFPDVVIEDNINNRMVKVPASVAAFGTLAFNDKVSFPWFAPAGFNRAALTFVKNVETRLNTNDKDILYDARINPIAVLPNSGFVIFGQKTLQQAKSALDRVNVRRLVLEVKRIVSQIANNLVFENNTDETREAFVKSVTPQLGMIQMRAGIEQFRVIMDNSNNTRDDVENNRINGKIIIVPTRAVEFIALDFIITNSGVNFLN